METTSPLGTQAEHRQRKSMAALDAVSSQVRRSRAHADSDATLRAPQVVFAFAIFVAWLALFAGGILIDTRPFRLQISPAGVAALEDRGGLSPSGARAAAGADGTATQPASSSFWEQLKPWAVVLICFLPINLAWICATASLLGAFGNRANLAEDHSGHRARDDTNPNLSAVLRGFFVYLFMTSGLLLLDDAPFANPAPGQYIRLAGFLSLFSFVVSYQPRLFSVLIVWAFHRIQVREGEDAGSEKHGSQSTYSKTTVAVAETQTTQVQETAPKNSQVPRN